MKSDYWNMKTPIPSIIVYCVESDIDFNNDDGSIFYFNDESEFESWKKQFEELQPYTGCCIYRIFRGK